MQNNFWSLLSKYPVTIPIIQRDYAQGRLSKEVEQIRIELLNTLYNAAHTDEKVDFDFIYGSVEENEFIPLDGQQRLTTLFLLHWYLALKEKKQTDAVKNILIRFSYETRASAADFCQALVQKGMIDDNLSLDELAPENLVSEIIKDASWFYRSWQQDQTVQSMLVMLDSIHRKFHDAEPCFARLTDVENPPVSFRSLELKNYGLTDLLYIKMNGRGKPLTDLETFRARFEQLLNEILPEFKTEFSSKMDGDWTDLFWHYRNPKTFLFDEEFMNFFRAIAVNRFALENDARTGAKIIEQKLVGYFANPGFAELKELGCFNTKGIRDIIYTLDVLSKGIDGVRTYLPNRIVLNEIKTLKDLITRSRDFTYAQRIQFFALTQYVITHGSDGIEEWARVIRNLTGNISYNGADEFMRDIKAVQQMLPDANDILIYLSKNPITGFMLIQREEEMIKAQLINKGDDWRTAIIQVENHGYFTGQIGFLLKFSGIKAYFDEHNSTDWTEDQNMSFLDEFEKYANKASAIFLYNGLLEIPNFLWERALLSKGDYLFTHGQNESFLVDNHREISWKRYLRDDHPRRDLLKVLFDDIEEIKNDLSLHLRLAKIITNYVNDPAAERWRRTLIQRNGMIEACGKDRYIRFNSENDILLLETSRTSGFHRECYSYALALRLGTLGHQVGYSGVTTVKEMAGISYIDNKNIRITYWYYDEKWQYKVVTNAEQLFESEDDVFAFLVANGYVSIKS